MPPRGAAVLSRRLIELAAKDAVHDLGLRKARGGRNPGHRPVRARKQFLGLGDAQAAQLGGRRAAQNPPESLLQRAPRERRLPQHVANVERSIGVFAQILQSLGQLAILHGQHVGRVPGQHTERLDGQRRPVGRPCPPGSVPARRPLRSRRVRCRNRRPTTADTKRCREVRHLLRRRSPLLRGCGNRPKRRPRAGNVPARHPRPGCRPALRATASQRSSSVRVDPRRESLRRHSVKHRACSRRPRTASAKVWPHPIVIVRLIRHAAVGQRAKAPIDQVCRRQAGRLLIVADHLRKGIARHHAARDIHDRNAQPAQGGGLRAMHDARDDAVDVPMPGNAGVLADPARLQQNLPRGLFARIAGHAANNQAAESHRRVDQQGNPLGPCAKTWLLPDEPRRWLRKTSKHLRIMSYPAPACEASILKFVQTDRLLPTAA